MTARSHGGQVIDIHAAPLGQSAGMIGPAIPKLQEGRYSLERRRRADEPSLFARKEGGMSKAKRFVWTLDDLREDLVRWEQELRSMTNAEGQHYPEHTIKTHIGHSAQFIRWLAGEWQPQGPRRR